MDKASRRFTWLYAWSQIRLKYRYTAVGFAWNFLEPALFLGVLSVVFSVVNRMEITDYAVFLFSALVPWRYFEKVVSTCTDSIVQGDWLIKKMPVSPFALPLTRFFVATVEFAFSFAVLLALLAVLKPQWTVHILAVPVAVIPWAVFGLGVALITATLFTFYRDVRPLVQMALMLAFFSSPILFRSDLFAAGSTQSSLLRWHPFTYFAALFQKPIHTMAWPSALDWTVSFAVAILSLVLGATLIRFSRRRFYFYV